MKSYQDVLLALELDPESDARLIKKAQEMQSQYQSKITLVHAVENLGNYGAAYGVMAGVDVEEELFKEAEKLLAEAGAKLNIARDNQVVKIGPAKQVILEEAEQRSADLIIVGSHGRHGVRLLLGSTANTILHGAQCDVLAVRVQD